MKIEAEELTSLKMSTRPPEAVVASGYRVVCDGDVKCWVGFGWVTEGKATVTDHVKYPEVIWKD